MIKTDTQQELEGQMALNLGWPEGSYEKYMEYFGKVVKLTVPVEFWTDDWHRGMRWRVYVGRVCSHSGGGVCVQVPVKSQNDEQRTLSQCIPLKNGMHLEVLPGRLSDY